MGMTALRFPQAWDSQTGYAYIGVLDNGIQRNHPDLGEGRAGNVRAQFSGSWGASWPIPSNAGFDENLHQFGLGHGSHVAGIIGATSNNADGVTGACHNCSLAIAKISDASGTPETNFVAGIYGMVRRGVQAINLSLGRPNVSCGGTPAALQAYCDAIQHATDRDIIMVAAAGNSKSSLNFPASDSRTFSVGGYQSDNALWNQQVALGVDSPRREDFSTTEIGTNFGANQLVVAPARDILSTMWINSQWAGRCGSVSTFNTNPNLYESYFGSVVQSIFAASSGNLYGICTGTSMAAPHITGLIGLMRSSDPIMTTALTRTRLANSAGGSFISTSWGHGLPKADEAVVSSLASERLTPLFAFTTTAGDDYAYTVFPQMGAALNDGTVPPYIGANTSGTNYYSYSWIGNPVAQYPSTFPGVTIMVKPPLVTADAYRPRAKLRVFTTPRTASGVQLWPICRFSYVALSTTVRHIIDTAPTCAQSALPSIAILDGQEGYVFPPNQPQPSGTVAAIRMERVPAGGGPSIFVFTAASDQAYYASLGFYNPVVLGYAYLN